MHNSPKRELQFDLYKTEVQLNMQEVVIDMLPPKTSMAIKAQGGECGGGGGGGGGVRFQHCDGKL